MIVRFWDLVPPGYAPMLKFCVAAAFLAGLCCVQSSPVWAADAESHACSQITRDKSRLACYDEAFGRPSAELTAAELAAEKAKAEREFGLSAKQVQERDPDFEAPVVIEGLESTVAKVKATKPGRPQVVTLANGQVWALTEGSVRGYLSVGDAVSIRKGGFGTHRLITPGGAGLRAKRLR